MKKRLLLFALITSLFGVSHVFSQTNLLAGLWDGNGITGTASKPNDVGWTNSVTASIPWTVANGSGGARFRDYNVTGGHTGFTNESDGSTSITRQLMFRWDNAAYATSYYAFPVTLESGKFYKFSFDYVLGGSGTPPNTITVGVSSTIDGTGRLSYKTFTTTNSATIYRNGSYEFNVATNGSYYINFNSALNAWYGITNLSIVEITEVDKTQLLNQLNVANGMVASPQPVGASTAYADLASAISTAQALYDNVSASPNQVFEEVNKLKLAISKVNSAILIQQRASTWTTLPYDITSLIVNPSFETATANNQSTFNGWTNVGPLVSQNNTSFPFKAGTYYIEKWKSSGNWTGLKISQKIIDLPNGIYKLTAGALNEPNTTGGAFVFANEVKAEVFAANNYTVTVTVTNNQLEIGYEVVNGGNYVATDNFRLSYISDGSPYLVLAPENLFFDANNLTKTFTVNGGNLTANATLTAPAGITLDKTSLTPAEVAAGTTITATYDNATAIMNAKITVTSGTAIQEINVIGSADAACFVPMGSPNLIPNPYLNSLAPFAGWGHKSIVYGAEAYCGAAAVKFNATTNGWPDGAALDVNGIAWEANSTYRVRAMVKSVDGTFAFFAKDADPDVTISIPQSNDDWVLIDQTFTTGAAPTTNFFSFNNVDGGSTGKVAYIDNWELFKVGPSTSVSSLRSTSKLNAFIQNGRVVANFEANVDGKAELAIYNVQGVELAKVNANVVKGQNQYTFNTELPSGVYVIRMSENNITTTVKVVK